MTLDNAAAKETCCHHITWASIGESAGKIALACTASCSAAARRRTASPQSIEMCSTTCSLSLYPASGTLCIMIIRLLMVHAWRTHQLNGTFWFSRDQTKTDYTGAVQSTAPAVAHFGLSELKAHSLIQIYRNCRNDNFEASTVYIAQSTSWNTDSIVSAGA